MNKRISVFLLFFILMSFQANAQTNAADSPGAFDMSGSPQWAQDLRRGSIVAFGSFPFTFFFTTFFMDTSRLISNDFDQRYAPWPFKPAGAIDMTHDQQIMSIGIAAASSLVIAFIDYLIVSNNRNRQSREVRGIEPEPPLIIRTPVDSWQPLPLITEEPAADQPAEEPPETETETETEIDGTDA